MNLIFDEPVRFQDPTSISVINLRINSLKQPLKTAVAKYRLLATQVTLTISDFCPTAWVLESDSNDTCTVNSLATSFLAIANSSYSHLYLALGTNSFYDYAASPNAVSELSFTGKVAETGPGTVFDT